ncbi:MAG: proline dehydrogenase [Chloroflexi bacterium]|jgi:proline dehydrogenase|nr:proline dehydrogenase [Chloroflexota bacterium]
MMRSFFLYLARATWAKSFIMRLGIARRTALRFIAGESLAEGIEATRALNARGLEATLDHLGESVYNEAGARQATQDYLELLNAIAESGVKATVSLKLTQLGLDVSEELCLENMRAILDCARLQGNHATIDMESSDYTDRTLALYRKLRDEEGFKCVGIVIQSYLYRSQADMQALAAEGAYVRLCKGAYKEPPDRAFPDKSDVDANYVRLVEEFLTPEARAAGAYLCIATHDEKMISAAQAHVKAHDVPYDSFEFQMLYGIRGKLQQELHDDGYHVRVYVPYGTQWYPYYMRRLAERPANVWFLMSNFFRR